MSDQVKPKTPPTLVDPTEIETPTGSSPRFGSVHDAKERHAHWLASSLVNTFAAAVVIILLSLLLILWKHPADAKTLLVDAWIPALKEAGSFLSGVFGPLLAFVLGYYFGEKNAARAAPTGRTSRRASLPRDSENSL